ncbi:MAG: hypothetical protein IH995_07365 [Proteobacteria bacterium]|nr:hypothetical protein [Pseudomonadota bacterium]
MVDYLAIQYKLEKGFKIQNGIEFPKGVYSIIPSFIVQKVEGKKKTTSYKLIAHKKERFEIELSAEDFEKIRGNFVEIGIT